MVHRQYGDEGGMIRGRWGWGTRGFTAKLAKISYAKLAYSSPPGFNKINFILRNKLTQDV